MIKEEKRDKGKMKEMVVDIAKDFFSWVFLTGASFVYWLAVLLIISLVLMNIWVTSFDAILKYAIILMCITSVVLLIRTLRKRFKS